MPRPLAPSWRGAVPIALCWVILAFSSWAAGQEAPVADSIATLTVEQVTRLQREVEVAADLTEETRKSIVAALAAAAADLQIAADHAARAEAFRADAAAAPQRVADLQAQAAQPQVAASGMPSVEAPLAELEQHVAKLEAKLSADKKSLAAIEAEPQARSQRRKEIHARAATLQTQLSELAPRVAAPDEPLLLASSRAAELAARRQALSAEQLALEAEIAKYDAANAVDLLRVKTDCLARRVAETERLLAEWRQHYKQRREAFAKESVRKARIESYVANPLLKEQAEHNRELTETAAALTQRLNQAEQDLKATRDARAALEKQFRLARKKVETVGLTSSVGAMLRKQRKSLPNVAAQQAAIAARRPLIDEINYQLSEYQFDRSELGDIESQAAQIVADAPADDDIDLLATAARELLERQREYLDGLVGTCNNYFDTLIELDTTEREFVSLATQYEEYIDERVLWIRSGKSLASEYAVDEADLLAVSPAAWIELGQQTLTDVRRNGWAWGAFAVIFIAMASQVRRLRRSIAAAGNVAEKANCRTIGPTFESLIKSILVALVWPVFTAAIGWRLCLAPDTSGFAPAVGQGLWLTSLMWAPVEVFRQICRPHGLGESHFGWSRSVTGFFRRQTRWLTGIGLPLALATISLGALDATRSRDSVERTLFIAGMLVAAVFAYRCFSAGAALKEYYAYHKGSWVERLRRVWPWLAAAPFVTLAGLAFTGFYYTAVTLGWRGFQTSCFLAALIVLRSVLLRMLLLRRRNLAMAQARERAQAAAAAATAGGEPIADEVAGIPTSTPQADLVTHSEQTRRLVSTGLMAASVVGLWLIWSSALPALGMLDRYTVWGEEVVSVGATPIATMITAPNTAPITPPSGGPTTNGPLIDPMPPGSPTAPSAQVSGSSNHVTWADVALGVLVAFVTFVVARNGPGLLEMSVLQQLPLEPSIRYAITTLVSYAIILAGTITACSAVGLEWSQVQWLATALTFGLAFGLQEIFANFVAGLIILLERPIRVGDVVTIDNVTGVVSRIRIRATSITDWDRKEYVVPNKEFITGRLLNWTLSDKTNRIVINVGVAYGSDTERARELLLESANAHPLILKDPPSIATFEGFGDNSLNLVLRTYLPSLDNRLDVINQLHTSIDLAFRREGIEMAFPQRDLHIKSAPEALLRAMTRERQGSNREGKNAA